MTNKYAEYMLEKHVASVALAKLRYNVIHKVSGMTPTVKVTNIKRKKDEIIMTIKNDIREITLIANQAGGIYGTFNSYVGNTSFDNNAAQWFDDNFKSIDLNHLAMQIEKQANQIIIDAINRKGKAAA